MTATVLSRMRAHVDIGVLNQFNQVLVTRCWDEDHNEDKDEDDA
ncbi:hypothetical protein FHX51_000440 [Aeriscardovia aeriphila]|nr:hypothetical protein [Aeriscardovia aeriphila]